MDRWGWIYSNFFYYPPIISDRQIVLQISHINLVIMFITRYFFQDNVNTPQVIKAQGIMKNQVIPYRESMEWILTHIQQRHK